MINLFTLLAQGDPIGKIVPPDYIKSGIEDGKLTGIVTFLNSVLRLVFIAAGIWALFNLIMAGFAFINAGGDAKEISKAWDKIWQTFVGVIIIVSSFLIAAIMGMLFFGNPAAILQPTLK